MVSQNLPLIQNPRQSTFLSRQRFLWIIKTRQGLSKRYGPTRPLRVSVLMAHKKDVSLVSYPVTYPNHKLLLHHLNWNPIKAVWNDWWPGEPFWASKNVWCSKNNGIAWLGIWLGLFNIDARVPSEFEVLQVNFSEKMNSSEFGQKLVFWP